MIIRYKRSQCDRSQITTVKEFVFCFYLKIHNMAYVGNGVVIRGHPRRMLPEDPSPGLKVRAARPAPRCYALQN